MGILGLLTVIQATVHPATLYRVVELAQPHWDWSRTVDINDHGTVVGNFRHGTNSGVFLWATGQVAIVQTPGLEASANAINNRNEIVGSFTPLPVLDENGNPTWRHHAYLHSGDTNYDLGEPFDTSSAALDINDRGDVVGYVGSDPYILSEPQTNMTPPYSGPPSAPPPEWLHAINENREVVGNRFKSRAFEPKSREYLPGAHEALAINSVGQIVGAGAVRLSSSQPVLWEGTNATWLGAPFQNSRANDINDQGVIIGTSGDWPSQKAILWKDGIGIDLQTVISLPASVELISADALNENGFIAATLRRDGTELAALLQPTDEPLETASLHFTSPTDGIQPTNVVQAAISWDSWPKKVKQVTYFLNTRHLHRDTLGGDFYSPPTWSDFPSQTNTTTEPPFEARFTELPTGHYALGAELIDIEGVRAFLTPIYFTISAPPVMKTLWLDMFGSFTFGFHGGAGYRYIVEESTNLIHWTPHSSETLGGAFFRSTLNDPGRFFRARVIETNADYAGVYIPSKAVTPDTIVGRTIHLGGTPEWMMNLTFDESRVHADYLLEPETTYSGVYTYQLVNGRGKLNMLFEDVVHFEYNLELEWLADPQTGSSFENGIWRGSYLYENQRAEAIGSFTLRPGE